MTFEETWERAAKKNPAIKTADNIKVKRENLEKFARAFYQAGRDSVQQVRIEDFFAGLWKG
jgi:hypothetical protein